MLLIECLKSITIRNGEKEKDKREKGRKREREREREKENHRNLEGALRAFRVAFPPKWRSPFFSELFVKSPVTNSSNKAAIQKCAVVNQASPFRA